jgi:hypothetical protein
MKLFLSLRPDLVWGLSEHLDLQESNYTNHRNGSFNCTEDITFKGIEFGISPYFEIVTCAVSDIYAYL